MKLSPRPVLALALCAGLAGVTGLSSASAAPKPVCKLVTDPAGDTVVYPVAGQTSDAMDIVSMDVATSKRIVTAVVRVKKLAMTDVHAPTGMSWSANFVASGITLSLSAHTGPAGTPLFYASYDDPTVGGSIYAAPVEGVFDLAKNEIRMSASVSTFAGEAAITPGKTKLTDLSATTGAEVLIPLPVGSFGNTLFSTTVGTADTASGGKDYLAGTASCVAVGK